MNEFGYGLMENGASLKELEKYIANAEAQSGKEETEYYLGNAREHNRIIRRNPVRIL